MSQQTSSNVIQADSLAESMGDEYLVYALVAEQVERCLKENRDIDVSGVIEDHPQLEQQIRELIPSLTALYQICPLEEEARTREVGGFRKNRRTMLGDFALGREIGRGGMGVVYEAIQVSLGRRVALKVLPFAAVLDKRQLQRFKNEAQAAAALHHQNIVPVFAVGCERGVHFYAMQYIEGQDLSAALSQLRHLCGGDPVSKSCDAHERENVKRYPPAAADAETRRYDTSTAGGFCKGDEYFRTIAEMAVQAAEGLDYAHQQGIVHRDIKPSNLMLDDDGKIWITDFGLAQIESDMTLTGTGDMVGTLRYMSPEQISGRPTDVDHRSDVYGLGATLYELATLQPPHGAHTRAELMHERKHRDPKTPRAIDPTIPLDLETIILKAISKTPDARYRTAGAFAADLRHFLEGRPIAARRPDLRARAGEWMKQNRHLVASACILAFGVVLFIAGWSLAPRLARRQPLPAESNPPQTAQTLGANDPAAQTAQTANSKKVLAASAIGDRPPATSVELQKRTQSDGASTSTDVAVIEPHRQATRGANESPAATRHAKVETQPEAADPSKSPQQAGTFSIPEPTPPPLPTFRTGGDRDAYVELIERLLDAGLNQTGQQIVKKAKSHAAEARRLCADDPRLGYALGLVMLRNFRSQEALQQFQFAQSAGDYPYLPALQAEIWYLVSRKDYEPGLERLAKLAKLIGESPAGWPDPPARTAAAHWIGRIAGYLDGPGASRKANELMQRPDMDWRALLGKDYHEAYDAGRQATAVAHEKLVADVEALRQTSQITQQDNLREKRDEVTDRRQQVTGKRDQLQLSLQQWEDWLSDQQAQADESLSELETQYVNLEEQARSLQRSIQALDFEINVITQIINDRSSRTRLISRSDAQIELTIKNDQMLRYQAQYNACERQAALINQRAQTLLVQRNEAGNRFERETGKMVRQDQKLKSWTKRLDRLEQRLHQQPVGRSVQFSAAMRNLKSLRSYVDIDWKAESQRILESYIVRGSSNASQ